MEISYNCIKRDFSHNKPTGGLGFQEHLWAAQVCAPSAKLLLWSLCQLSAYCLSAPNAPFGPVLCNRSVPCAWFPVPVGLRQRRVVEGHRRREETCFLALVCSPQQPWDSTSSSPRVFAAASPVQHFPTSSSPPAPWRAGFGQVPEGWLPTSSAGTTASLLCPLQQGLHVPLRGPSSCALFAASHSSDACTQRSSANHLNVLTQTLTPKNSSNSGTLVLDVHWFQEAWPVPKMTSIKQNFFP